MSYPRSIFGPLFLISAGAIWLLIKAGTIPSENLWALAYIWPYFLIAAGIGLILRSYWRYANLVMDVVIIGGTIFAILSAPKLGWNTPSMTANFYRGGLYFGPGEKGSGNVIEETRKVEDFTAIELDYPAQVYVTQGDKVSLTIEGEDNLLPGLKTTVRNDTLRIYYEPEDGQYVRSTKAVVIHVVVKDLNDVEFDGAGELNVDQLETDELHISVSGAGSLKLKEMQIKDLSIDLSGAGSVNATGEADNLDLTISGFGSFNGKDLHNKTANIQLSGAGSATVWVDDELDAAISGAGSVNYYGSPDVTKNISGAGSVSKSGDK